MTGLIAHLQSKHPTWPPSKCRFVAEKIAADQAERQKAAKVKLASAQLLMPIDGLAAEEKNDPTEPDDASINF